MGLHVIALDIGEQKLELARRVGADAVVDASDPAAIQRVLETRHGGAHGVVVTAVSSPAFSQAISMARRRGTVSLGIFADLKAGNVTGRLVMRIGAL